jgi:predicted peptidase
MMDYAIDPANGMNIDKSRIYLCGFSLGAGGTITALNFTSTNRRLAAAAGIGPGYFGGSTHSVIAKSGVPMWLCHAANDTVAPVAVSDAWVRNVRNARPIYDVKYERWDTSNHSGQFRLFDINVGAQYTQATGSLASPPITQIAEIAKHTPNLWQWFLKYSRKDNIDPFYI